MLKKQIGISKRKIPFLVSLLLIYILYWKVIFDEIKI